MPETVTKLIGIMDPNGYSFRTALEQLLEYLHVEIEYDGKINAIKSRRIKTRPYNILEVQCPYSAIINRGAHWNPHHYSYFISVGQQVYLLNDMISFQAIDKNVGYSYMSRMGINIPKTIAIPQQDYKELLESPRINPELIFNDHELFDLEELGEEVGYPAYLKPQSGGGWVGVERVHNAKELVEIYNKSGAKPMNLQKAIDYREFVRTVGIGPQMIPMHYNARAKFSHDRYLRSETQAIDHQFLTPEEGDEVCKITKFINAFFGWCHNSCESLISTDDGKIYPIDFCNAYPDSSLVSLHYYFPEIVKNMARWLIFCAVTGKKKTFDFSYRWKDFFAIANDTSLSYKQRLDLYAAIADEHFETARFETFCREKMPDFERQALDYFSSDEFQKVLEKEVQYYFKVPHEVPSKIAHYTGIHQFWLSCERKRLGLTQ